MLVAVQNYIKGVLDGLQSPQLPPLQALIQPPVLSDVAERPFAFIWAGHAPIVRQTAPRVVKLSTGGFRGGGYQKVDWAVSIRLYTVMSQEDPNIETAFPGLIDQAVIELSTTPLVVITTDPLTGQDTEILTIGEKITLDYASAVVTNGTSQGLIRFACDLDTMVEEKLAPSEGVYGSVS